MNYSSSRNNIIPVTNDTPTLLTNFINTLHSNTKYDISFLMMPVRLETRFRKVIENILDELASSSVAAVDASLATTTGLTTSYGSFTGFSSGTALSAAGEIMAGLSSVPQALGAITSLSPVEQSSLAYRAVQANDAFMKTAASLQAQCTDEQLSAQLSQTIDSINAMLRSIQQTITNMPVDMNWQQEVSQNMVQTWGGASGIIANNAQLLSQMVKNGTIQQPVFDQYINSSLQLLNFFTSSTVTSSVDRQYVWTQINPLTNQFATLNSLLSGANREDPDTLASQRLTFNITATKLNEAWYQLAFPGASQNRINPQNGIEDYKPSIQDVSPDAGNIGTTIGQVVGNAASILSQLTSNPEKWDPELFNQYNTTILSIPPILSTPLTDTLSQAFVWSNIAPLNDQFAALSSYISSFSPDAAPGAMDTFDSTSVSVGTAWTTSITTGADTSGTLGTGGLFSIWITVDELWIRVYPDDFEVDSLERGLTSDESAAGIAYWTAWWAAHGDKALQLQAWQTLVALYGPERAAWIVKQMTPTNLSGVIIVSPIFPVLTHLSLLSAYTTGIAALSATTLAASAGSYLSFYTPQLGYLTSTARSIPGITTAYAASAMESVRTASDSFTQLGSTIISLTSSQEGESPYVQTVAAISGMFSTLTDTFVSLPVYKTWDELYSETPVFPTPTIVSSTWQQPSVSNVMPDYFLFAAINNVSDGSYQFRHIKIGNLIPKPLYTSIDPVNATFSDTSINHLVVDPTILWMVDFDEAVSKGMGIKIRLTSSEARYGFDKILVLGTRLSGGTQATLPGISQQLLQDLLDSHHYTAGGLSLLTLGTPTNNTDATNSGYHQPDPYAEASFATEVSDPLFTGTSVTLNKKDGQWLSDALGIDYGILQHVANADKTQISDAIATNRVLWNGTIGNYMRDMLNFLFTEDNVQRAKSYFTDYVLGRGALPSIRVAEQPYGILPVTSFGRWQWKQLYNKPFPSGLSTSDGSGNATSYFSDDYTGPLGADLSSFLQDRFNLRIYSALEILNNAWLDMATWKVKTVDKNKGITSTQADFMDLLGIDASMSEVYNRYFLNRMQFDSSYAFSTQGGSPDSIWAGTSILDIPTSFFNLFGNFNSSAFSPGPPAGANPNSLGNANGIFDINEFLSGTGGMPDMGRIQNAMRLFSLQFVENYKLYGPTVTEGTALSETAPLPNNYSGENYIKWLLTSNPYNIWNGNAFSSMPSRSLFFLLLRQGVLLTYREAAWDILEAANIFTKISRKIVGTPEGIVTMQANTIAADSILTKWHLLFENITNLTSSHYLGTSVNLWPSFNFYYNYVGDISSTSRPPYAAPAWQGIKLADYLFAPSPSLGSGYSALNAIGSPFLSSITDMKASLTQLQNCSTAELDRLVREHLDLCSYRVDAWNYGMVNKKLWTQRNTDGANTTGARKEGIYLACYGWLIDVRPKLVPGTATSALTAMNPVHVPAGLSEFSTVYYDKTNLGFIQTPSMAHALSAAVLRSGYISEKNSDDNRFAVNLTSERVDLALSIMEGLRNGQTMGALLGFRFENGLHNGYPTLELDKFIYPLRQKYSIVDPATETVTAIPASQNIRPSNVIDGVKLLNDVLADTHVSQYMNEYPSVSLYDIFTSTATGPYALGGHALSEYVPFTLFSGITVPTYTTAEFNAIMIEIDRIANAIDAFGDLAISEGVFQVAKGNFNRAAAVMESLTESKNPTRPEIIDTPRSGIHVNHKLAAMAEPVSSSSPWNSTVASPAFTITPRAAAEPNLNKWVSELLIAPFSTTSGVTASNFPDKIGCKVTFNDIHNVPQNTTVLLSQLQIQPIDLLYLVQSDAYKDELTSRITYYVRNTSTLYNTGTTGIPANVPVTVLLGDMGTAHTSFQAILSLLLSTSRTINTSKWLKAADFVFTPNATTDTTKPIYDIPEFQARAQAVRNSAHTLAGTLSGYPTSIADSTSNNSLLNTIRGALLSAANYGLAYAVPNTASDAFTSTPDTTVEGLVADMLTLVHKAAADLTQKYTQADTILSTIAGMTDQSKQADACLLVITTILGDGFKATPHFFFDYYPGLKTGSGSIDDLLTPAITTTSGIMRYHATTFDFDMDNWLYGLARVQTKTDDIETIRLLSDDSVTHPLKAIRPVQFPYIPASTIPLVDEDYWYGLSYPSAYTPSSDKLSVAIFNYNQLAASVLSTSAGYTTYKVYCGLLIEEWNELIPFNDETTGITFNYDQPRAKPPQNLLLAVNPQVLQASEAGVVKTWSLEDLLYTMLDTMDMAKLRMVEPDHFARAQFGTDIRNNENGNALDNGVGSIQYASGADSNNTAYFEAFKWILPAVVGEVTPAKVDASGNAVLSHGKLVYQSTDSLQQVSFDYNPNDGPVPIMPGSGVVVSGGLSSATNWAAVSTDTMLTDAGLGTLFTETAHSTDLATLEYSMVAISGVGL